MTSSPGVHPPRSIDLITQTQEGTIVLVMIEDRSWDGSEERLMQLQEKINTYLAFALDGAMTAQYPETRGKPVSIRLDCRHHPDDVTLQFLDAIRQQIASDEVPITVSVL